MTPRLTVVAVGEGAAAGVAGCAGEFEPDFDSEADSGADFVSSDLRHMGTSTLQIPKLRSWVCRATGREAKVVHGESGVKRESSAAMLKARRKSRSPTENTYGMPREELYLATPVV